MLSYWPNPDLPDSSGLSLARVEEVDSRVGANGPVGVLATSVDAGEGLLMEKHLFQAHVWILSALLWQLWPDFALVEKEETEQTTRTADMYVI